MVATTLKRAAIGFVLGMIVGVLIVIIEGFSNGGELQLPETLLAATGSEAGALLAQMLASGVFGAVPWAGITFYELESWGMLKQAVVHFATYMAAFLLIGTCVGWLEPTPPVIGIFVGVFAVGHTIIWLVMYARYKAEVEQIDVLLQEARQTA